MLIFNESPHTNIAAMQRNVPSKPGKTTSFQVWLLSTQLLLYLHGIISSPSATFLSTSFDPPADNPSYPPMHVSSAILISIGLHWRFRALV
jgi:hypothetical protein